MHQRSLSLPHAHGQQVAANTKGIALVGQLISEHGLATVVAYMGHIQANAEAAVREMLRAFSLRQVRRLAQRSFRAASAGLGGWVGASLATSLAARLPRTPRR